MGYVPGCRYDLFISYASENNRDGWVEQFEKNLGEELGDLLGRQFDPNESIYLDKRDLRVGQSFPDELASAARESAILVPILSPGYLTSEWCNKERKEFFSKLSEGAEPAECLTPIQVRPVADDELDAFYRKAERMSFLSADKQTPLAVGSPDWTAQLRKFAAQLTKALQVLRQRCKPVFLGKTAETDRAEKLRSWCRTEIEHRHFRIVPESLPVLDDSDGVRANLQGAGLAIHFLGGADDKVFDAIETSVAVCSGPTILYQAFGSDLLPDEQVLLDAFEKDLKAPQGRYQRLTGKNDQELILLIDEQFKQLPPEPRKTNGSIELALVCDEQDLDAARQFKGELKIKRPVGVESSDFVASHLKAMELLRKWNEYLSSSDTLLFYYGATERTRLEPIWQKAAKDRPQARRVWFLAPPDVERKQKEFPNALSSLEQVVAFIEAQKGAHA